MGRTHAAPTPAEHQISADEERLVRRDKGPSLDKTRHFVTDLYQRLVDNLSGTTTEERFRMYAGGREVAQIVRQNGVDETLYFHADNLGTPDTITTSDGQVLHQEFDAFGSEVSAPNTELTRSGFTGHDHDRDLRLIDMKGRVYDPLAARFTTQDPIMQAPFWSQGLNRYAYVFNDPVNATDPSGFMVDSAGSGGGIMMAGLMAGGLGSVAYQGFASGMASPLTGGLGAINIGLRFLTGMPGLSSTPSARTSFATGSAAATTQPGANGMHAVGQSDSVSAPVGPNPASQCAITGLCLAQGSFSGAGASGTWEPAPRTPTPTPPVVRTDTPPSLSPAGPQVLTKAALLRALDRSLADTLRRLNSALQFPGSPIVEPSGVLGRTPASIDAMARRVGLVPKRPDPGAGRGAYVDPVTGEQRVLVHPRGPSPHAHVNDPAGNRLSSQGSIVSPESQAAHLPIGCTSHEY